MKLTDTMDRPRRSRRVTVRVKRGSGMFKYIFLLVVLYILFRGEPDLLDATIGSLLK